MDLSRFNITGRKEAALVVAQNNQRLIRVRWIYMILVAGVAIGTTLLAKGNTPAVLFYSCVLAAGLAVNGIFALLVHIAKTQLRTQRLLTFAQLTMDLAMAGVVTFVMGGVDARTTVLFVFPILVAALIFHGSLVMLVAALSGATYVATVLLDQYIHERSIDLTLLTVPLLFYPAVFLLLGQIVKSLEHIETIEAREKAYDSFLSLIAHQLKHPASAVTTIIDAIDHSKTPPNDEVRQYIAMLKAENENQTRLIDNLLEAAPHRHGELHLEEIRIDELVDKIAQKVAAANDRASDLKKMPESVESKIYASQIRLGLALTNIFDNAFRYSHPGDGVQYAVEERSDIVKILIRDSGKGMSEEQIAHQLKRFTNEGIRGMEDGHIGGLGLGLFAASQITNAHGGRLAIHSGSGVGTTVIVTLPKEQTDEKTRIND